MNKKYSQDENIIRKLRIYKRGIRIKGVSRFSVLSDEKRLFSEAILCLMCLWTNPLSKEAPDGGEDTASAWRIQQGH